MVWPVKGSIRDHPRDLFLGGKSWSLGPLRFPCPGDGYGGCGRCSLRHSTSQEDQEEDESVPDREGPQHLVSAAGNSFKVLVRHVRYSRGKYRDL